MELHIEDLEKYPLRSSAQLLPLLQKREQKPRRSTKTLCVEFCDVFARTTLVASMPGFKVEYAASGRSTCQVCKNFITQDSFRVAKMVRCLFSKKRYKFLFRSKLQVSMEKFLYGTTSTAFLPSTETKQLM